ncbi:metal-binding protein [Candidatus Acidianus copahuensis]|uniref:Metal-binding protein n=1 Tax=Candidatus Acidianus copahuensis TaxID=1160895 RepID=A0A031LJU3_9CREN|nr:hypothetical protein [Candidatus Acidianus copahuensis]EZQ03048.1 metal-binding protein [Candidatus Acidianus copahuensis]
MEESKSLKKVKLAVAENRIVRLTATDSFFSIYIYLAKEGGRHKDHILGENFCDCKYFVFHSIYSATPLECYHLRALKTTLSGEKIITINTSFKNITEIITDIYAYGKSLKLRKLITT